MQYPNEWHPVFFLIHALRELGAEVEFIKDTRTLECWGFSVNGRIGVWLIDNRHEWERIKEDPAAEELLKRGALVMHAQKQDALRVGGEWLPLAASPGYRLPDKPVEKLYDVGIVGYVRDAGRQAVLAHVARHFKLCAMQGVFGDAAVSAYWQSRIALNVPTGYGKPDAYDVPMRVMEILGTGVPLVTNYLPELEDLGIVEGVTCILYRDTDGVIDAIQRALASGGSAVQIGLNAAQLAAERHTYRHRAEQVLQWSK